MRNGNRTKPLLEATVKPGSMPGADVLITARLSKRASATRQAPDNLASMREPVRLRDYCAPSTVNSALRMRT